MKKWPRKLRHRGRVLIVIYRPTAKYAFYRAAYVADGRRFMKSFANYSGQGGAKEWAEEKLKELKKGSKAASLTPGQALDALAALDALQRFYQDTGERLTLLEAVSGQCSAMKRLGERSVAEAIDGFLSTVADIKPVDLGKAMKEFIEERRLRTIPREAGKRPALSPEHHYNTALWLNEFASKFPGSAVRDLKKEHLGLYMKQFASLSPKTRNERRGVVKMFLQWAVERDYLAPTHRLFESGALKMDSGDDDGEIEVYSAEDLKAILDRASRAPHPPAKEGEQPEANYRHLLPVLSLAGLAGLRLKEAMRLTFEEVFKRPDHLELTKTKSKTRSRRLIPICPALSSWLEYCRGQTGPIWSKSYDMFHLDFAALRKELEIESRHNGLRHSFISAHFAAYSDENLTAAQAGNSPAMIHSHYKGLLTKKEGEAWFAVAPEQPANVIPLAASPDN